MPQYSVLIHGVRAPLRSGRLAGREAGAVSKKTVGRHAGNGTLLLLASTLC